jgi:hypothetical protein
MDSVHAFEIILKNRDCEKTYKSGLLMYIKIMGHGKGKLLHSRSMSSKQPDKKLFSPIIRRSFFYSFGREVDM